MITQKLKEKLAAVARPALCGIAVPQIKMMLRFGALCLLLSMAGSAAHATDRTFSVVNSYDFNDPLNWTPNGVPGPSDNALIKDVAGGAVYVSANRTMGGLTINGAGLSVNGGVSFTIGSGGVASTIQAYGSLDNNGTFTNSGPITVGGNQSSISSGDTGIGIFYVNAPWTIGDGSQQLSGNQAFLDGSTVYVNAAITVNSGGNMLIEALGTMTINPSTGSLSISGTLDAFSATIIGGGITINSGAVFTLSSGTLQGTAVAQTVTIASGATMTVDGSSSFDKMTTVNRGTVNLNSSLLMQNGAIFNNESGGLVKAGNGDCGSNSSSTSLPTFNNKAGAIVRVLGIGSGALLTFGGINFSNSGTVDIQGGTLQIIPGFGSHFTNLSGTTLTGGTYLITGTSNYPGSLSIPSDIATNAANITLNTSAATIDNNLTSTDALIPFKTNAAAGTLTLTGNKTLAIPSTTGNFTNAGTVTLGTSSKLNVQGAAKNYIQTGGTTDLQGGTLATTATGNVNINGGSLIGNGTINSTVVNGGTVAPGHSPGIITVNTNYTQSGALNMEIGGTNAATPDYDQLAVTGTVTLGGALNLSLINGFTPTLGNTFTLISNSGTDAVVGTFTGLPQGATVTLGGKPFQINYSGGDGNDVVLNVMPVFSINNVTLTEGDTGTANATFTVTLSGASSQTVTVNYATANGTATAPADYTNTSGTLTFAPGVITQSINVPVVGDLIDELDETFTVTLSNPAGGTIGTGTGTGTITDNDTSLITINDVGVSENGGPAVFSVSLSTSNSRTVTVSYTTADNTATAGSDYTTTAGTLTWAAGDTSAKAINVPILDDAIVEGPETFFVNLSGATNASISDAQGIGTITDNDQPKIFVSDVQMFEGDIGNRVLYFTIALSAPPAADVTVNYATQAGSAVPVSDYLTNSGVYTFPANTTILSKAVSVRIIGDTTAEANETFALQLTSVTGATILKANGIGTIVNDDGAYNGPVNVSVTPNSGGAAAGTPVTFTTVQTDVDGATDITNSQFIVNTNTVATNSVWCYYNAVTNKLYLKNDAGTFIGGFAPGSANVISNSQGSLNCAATTVVKSGNTLTVHWNLTFNASYTGTKNLLLYAKDSTNQANGFDNLGTWTITGAGSLGHASNAEDEPSQ